MAMLLCIILIFCSTLFTLTALIYIQQERKAKAHLQQKFQTYFQEQQGLSHHQLMKKGLTYRLFAPLAQRVSTLAQSILPTSTQSWLQMQLVQAGYQKPEHLKLLFGTILLSSLGAGLGFYLYSRQVVHLIESLALMGGLLFGIVGLLVPILWVTQKATTRRNIINRSLPDFMDLVVICVEAGLGLDMAINKFSRTATKKQLKPLQQEFSLYMHELNLGKPRNDALQDICYRTGVEELNGLVAAILQSFEMGTGIVEVLRVYAESMRVNRLERAKEKANKIPIKMVLPIYFFFFPAIFVTIFGPMGMVFIKSVASIFGHVDSLPHVH